MFVEYKPLEEAFSTLAFSCTKASANDDLEPVASLGITATPSFYVLVVAAFVLLQEG